MVVPLADRMDHVKPRAVLEVHHLAALAGFGQQLGFFGHKAPARRRGKQQPAAGPVHHHARDPDLGLEIDHRLDRLAKAARARQLVDAQRVEPPVIGRDQDLVSGLGVRDEGQPVTFLVFELLIERHMPAGRANPALARQDHGDRRFLDHRVHAEFDRRRRLLDPCAAAAQGGVFGIFLAQIAKVALQPGALAGRAFEQLLQLVLLFQQVFLFLPQLHLLKLAQTAQAHVEDRLDLPVGEVEFNHHHRLGIILGADDLDHPVEIEIGNDIAFNQFQPPRDLVQPVLAAALQDLDLARHPVLQQFLEAHHHRRAVGIEHIEVEPEAGFEIGQLEHRFLEQLGIDIAAPRHQHDADRLVAFVAHVLQDRQFLVGNRRRDLLDQLALLHLVRDFGNDQLPLPAAQPLDPGCAVRLVLGFGGMEHAPHAKRAAPGFIGFADHLAAVDDLPAGREIGPLEQFHQPGMFDMRIVDQFQRGVDDLGHIVAGDVGGHAHCNAAGAIGQQVGEQAGEDFGLLLLAIVGRDEIDRAFIQPRHQLQGGLGQPCLGVAIGGGIIAIDIAEIALPFDQRVTQREILRQPDHRVIDAGIAMRVILADHIAHHAGRLLEGRIGIKLQLPHCPQEATMDRLQPVAQVGQRARCYGRERIDEITFLQRGIERGIDNRVKGIGFGHIGHVSHRSRA